MHPTPARARIVAQAQALFVPATPATGNLPDYAGLDPALLDRVALDMPHVAIGSYPMFDRSLDYAVKVTVESVDPGSVEQALARLQAGLPSGSVIRTE